MTIESAENNRVKILHQALVNDSDPAQLRKIRNLLNSVTNQEVARFIEASPPIQRSLIWQLLDPEREGDVFIRLSEDVQETISTKLSKAELLHLLEDMDVDDSADLLNQLPERITDEVLNNMSEERRLRIEQVIDYPAETAGGIMDTNVVTIREDLTVEIVLRYLRMFDDLPDNTSNVFVVDRHGNYQGRVLIRKLITAAAQAPITEVMQPTTDYIEVHTPANTVVQQFQDNDWVSMAVVSHGKLVGRITVDDIVDIMAEEQNRELMQMVGLGVEEDTFASFQKSIGKRSLWLGINLLTAFIAISVIDQFQDIIEKVIAIAVILPLIASMGGIAGSQTMTIVIRGIALQHINSSNTAWLLKREMYLGMSSALLWSSFAGFLIGYWFDDYKLTQIVMIAMTVNLLAGAITGTLLPIFLKKIKIDPAVASGVILTTVTDVVGFLSFLVLATVYYG